MREPKGRYVPLTGPRLFINDLVHFARKVPSAPVSRVFDVSTLFEPRARHAARPSWACLFMKAYAIVGAAHAPLRRSYLEFPWPRTLRAPLDELCARDRARFRGGGWRFRGSFPALPKRRAWPRSSNRLQWYKNEKLEKVGFYRQALRFSRIPTPIRRSFWWVTLNVSGYKRCKRFGTFGLTSYGSLGAENLHPISPLTTTLTFGPIDPATGRVVVKLIYDHRVLDGAYIARRLGDIETVLKTTIRDELLENRNEVEAGPIEPAASAQGLMKPHLGSTAPAADHASRERAGDHS